MSFKSWYGNTFSDEIAHEDILKEAMREDDVYSDKGMEPMGEGWDISQFVPLPRPRGDTFDEEESENSDYTAYSLHPHAHLHERPFRHHHTSNSNDLLAGFVVGLGITAMYSAAVAAAAYGYSKIKGRDKDMD